MSEFITTGEVQVRPQKNKKLAMWCLVGPWVAMLILMPLWTVFNVVVQTTGSNALGNIVNVILGLVGVVCLIGVLFGWIAAIIIGSKRVPMQMTYDKRSGPVSTDPAPEEVKGWNWAAAFLSPLWGTWFGVWWWLLCMVPFVSMIWWIILGVFGNEWAWKADYWASVDEFKAAQKAWKPWGILVFVLAILGFVGSILGSASLAILLMSMSGSMN